MAKAPASHKLSALRGRDRKEKPRSGTTSTTAYIGFLFAEKTAGWMSPERTGGHAPYEYLSDDNNVVKLKLSRLYVCP